MQGIILAGGQGTRLRPYTTVIPKPLMPIGDFSILEVVVRQLKKYGFKKIVMAIGHQHQLFMAFFGNGEKWGIEINYFIEEKPLGTVGSIKHIDNLDEDFLLMNGDILTDLNYNQLMVFHKSHKSVLTIAAHQRSQEMNYGVLEYNSRGLLRKYSEKPILKFNVSMGVYAVSRKIIEHIPPDEHFDFPALAQKLISEHSRIYCLPYAGYWMDIGRPDDYAIAIDDFEKMKDIFL